MPSHPIAAEMETFWREHAARPSDPLWTKYLAVQSDIFIAKMIEMGEEHSNEGRFGMSKAGGCTRAASLKFMGHDSDLSGSTRATFAIGHAVEVMALATLVALGYEVTGFQSRASIDPMMSSSVDAIVRIAGVKTVVSVKSAGYKMSGKDWKNKGQWKRRGFAQYPVDGVKVTSPGYWAQAQAEMHALDAPQTLFIVVAKDMIKAMEEDPMMKRNGSMTFYAEIIHYDPAFVANQLLPIWAYQWEAVKNNDPGPAHYFTKRGEYVTLTPGDDKTNQELTGTYSPCLYCDLSTACLLSASLLDVIHTTPSDEVNA